MLDAKEIVSAELSHEIELSGRYSTKNEKGLIHALGAVESCTSEHDICYYCRVIRNYI